MREIQDSEAEAFLPQVLDDMGRRQEETDNAIWGIQDLRVRTGRITVDELLSAREEGRKR
jgi:hypothetical protein